MKSIFSRRLALALWLLLCLNAPSFGALPASGVWEVRAATGSDNNGGGIDAATVVTDYSQQAAAQLSETDLATTGVVTTLTSATGGFTAAMVGNFIHITSGTNFTPGWYEVTARASTNSVTLDRAPSTAAGSAGVGALGGALATLSNATGLAGAMVASNKAFVTGTTFTATTATAISFAQTVAATAAATPATRLIGYGVTRGDGTHAAVTLQTNTGQNGITTTGANFWIEQIDVDCASLGTSVGFQLSGQSAMLTRCKVVNFSLAGVSMGAILQTCTNCEIANGISPAVFGIGGNAGSALAIRQNFVHDNACPGIKAANYSTINFNLITNNSGGSSDGIQFGVGDIILNNTIHNSGGNGLKNLAASDSAIIILNNILTNNGGYGVNFSTGTALPASAYYDGNAYFNNTSGSRNLMDSIAGFFGVNPYTNTRDVILSASPYVGPTTGSTANFALNNMAGAGAACRGKGSPGTWPGNTGSTGFLDFGAVQSRGGIYRNPPMAKPPKPKHKVLKRALIRLRGRDWVAS